MTDPTNVARNGLSHLEKKEPQKAFTALKGVAATNAFAQLVLGMCMLDMGDAEAGLLVVGAVATMPSMLLHICPWLAKAHMAPANLMDMPVSVAISLRQFRRNDLKGKAVRTAHDAGIRMPDGSPILPEPPRGINDGYVCLVDGQRTDDLVRHVRRLGMSPKEYREFFESEEPRKEVTDRPEKAFARR